MPQSYQGRDAFRTFPITDVYTWEGSLTWLFCKYDIRNFGRHWVEARSPADANDTMWVRSVTWLRLRNIVIAARLQELLNGELLYGDRLSQEFDTKEESDM